MKARLMPIDDILTKARVIPVIEIADADHALPLAEALLEGGVRVMELTLRTAAGLEALRRLKARGPAEMIVGMGTVLDSDQAEAAAGDGADFLVTPGLTPTLMETLQGLKAPALPGVATVSEAMTARAAGFRALKLFPAAAVGGRALLKSFYGPLPDLVFCPTGGVERHEVDDWLALPNVACVGGSWVCPKPLLAAHDWSAITDLARLASGADKDENGGA